MDELEKLSKSGWRFAIWLKPGGACIIQGVFDDDEEGDWDFDEAAPSFSDALKKALIQVGFRVARASADDQAGKGVRR